jgi:hypothetical protein
MAYICLKQHRQNNASYAMPYFCTSVEGNNAYAKFIFLGYF